MVVHALRTLELWISSVVDVIGNLAHRFLSLIVSRIFFIFQISLSLSLSFKFRNSLFFLPLLSLWCLYNCLFVYQTAAVCFCVCLGLPVSLQSIICIIKGELHKPKSSIFCTISQNYQHFFEKQHYKQLGSEIVWETQKWHSNFRSPGGAWVIDWNTLLHGLINTLRTAWPTKILLPFLSLSKKKKDNHIIFEKSVDDFEIVHKTCSILI